MNPLPTKSSEINIRFHSAPVSTVGIKEFKARILYVEDDASLRDLGRQMLERRGYEVDTAGDGKDGLDALHCANYDLLITDQNMPRLTGLEMVSEASRAGIRTPVVFTSELPLSGAAGDCAAKIAAVIPKPFASTELLEKVGQTLARTSSIGPAGRAINSMARQFSGNSTPRHWGINE